MSRMAAIRNMARTAAPVLKTAGAAGIATAAAGAGIGLYTGKDAGTSMSMGGYAALGAIAGGASGALANYAKAMPTALQMAKRTGSWKGGFNVVKNSMSKVAPSMRHIAAGGLAGAGLGMGYATLNSNKPISFGERLKFEQERKRMQVEENLNQFRQMRQIMHETRMK